MCADSFGPYGENIVSVRLKAGGREEVRVIQVPGGTYTDLYGPHFNLAAPVPTLPPPPISSASAFWHLLVLRRRCCWTSMVARASLARTACLWQTTGEAIHLERLSRQEHQGGGGEGSGEGCAFVANDW